MPNRASQTSVPSVFSARASARFSRIKLFSLAFRIPRDKTTPLPESSTSRKPPFSAPARVINSRGLTMASNDTQWNKTGYTGESAIKYLFSFFFFIGKIWPSSLFVVTACCKSVKRRYKFDAFQKTVERMALWCLEARRSYRLFPFLAVFILFSFFLFFYWRYSFDICNVCTLLKRVRAYDIIVIPIKNADKFLRCIVVRYIIFLNKRQ